MNYTKQFIKIVLYKHCLYEIVLNRCHVFLFAISGTPVIVLITTDVFSFTYTLTNNPTFSKIKNY